MTPKVLEDGASPQKRRSAVRAIDGRGVYQRRGWDVNGIPTAEKLRALGMDLPEVVKVVEQAMKKS